jgi:Fic family protein
LQGGNAGEVISDDHVHPYTDGNGRIGRFLMNTMLASGGYPWTIVPLERRDEYMGALEAASVKQDIKPFAQLIGGLVGASQGSGNDSSSSV